MRRLQHCAPGERIPGRAFPSHAPTVTAPDGYRASRGVDLQRVQRAQHLLSAGFSSGAPARVPLDEVLALIHHPFVVSPGSASSRLAPILHCPRREAANPSRAVRHSGRPRELRHRLKRDWASTSSSMKEIYAEEHLAGRAARGLKPGHLGAWSVELRSRSYPLSRQRHGEVVEPVLYPKLRRGLINRIEGLKPCQPVPDPARRRVHSQAHGEYGRSSGRDRYLPHLSWSHLCDSRSR